MKQHLSFIVAYEVSSDKEAVDSPVDPSLQRSPLNQVDLSGPEGNIIAVFHSLRQEFSFPLQHNDLQLDSVENHGEMTKDKRGVSK